LYAKPSISLILHSLLIMTRQGLLDVAQIKAGETLVVSGAAGQVGSLVCQIGKLYGAKVIGIAGTDEKCRWLREELKIDAAINYKSPSFREEFKDAVGYLDVFFDNVGGEILNFAMTRLKQKARIALCGEFQQCRGYQIIFTVTIDVFRQAPFLITVRGSCCVWLASSNDAQSVDALKPKGISAYMNLIVQRAKIEGFVV
jgi:NADPH:quinone reductase-like Zn-dependent oxidoreductase